MNYYLIPGVKKDSDQKNITSLEAINRIVAEVFRTTPETLRIDTRKSEVVKPRQVAIYLMRKYTRFTLDAIGRFYGRDHATALYANNVINDLIEIRDYVYFNDIMKADYQVNLMNEQYDTNRPQTRKAVKFSSRVHKAVFASS